MQDNQFSLCSLSIMFFSNKIPVRHSCVKRPQQFSSHAQPFPNLRHFINQPTQQQFGLNWALPLLPLPFTAVSFETFVACHQFSIHVDEEVIATVVQPFVNVSSECSTPGSETDFAHTDNNTAPSENSNTQIQRSWTRSQANVAKMWSESVIRERTPDKQFDRKNRCNISSSASSLDHASVKEKYVNLGISSFTEGEDAPVTNLSPSSSPRSGKEGYISISGWLHCVPSSQGKTNCTPHVLLVPPPPCCHLRAEKQNVRSKTRKKSPVH